MRSVRLPFMYSILSDRNMIDSLYKAPGIGLISRIAAMYAQIAETRRVDDAQRLYVRPIVFFTTLSEQQWL
jgi:hypothetical protein